MRRMSSWLQTGVFRMHPPTKIAVLVALVAVAGLGLASTAAVPRESASRPDILLITVDSLRADALGSYGSSRLTSPNLDAFAREAVLISDAIAQAPYTKASMASLMTGLLPGAHKTYTVSKAAASILKRNGQVKGSFDVTDALPVELPTLADQLRTAGYRTVGLNTNPNLVAAFGYGRGFDDYRFVGGGEVYSRAPEVLQQALDVLRAPRTQPRFVWVHLMDTHNPYTPSEPYRSMFPVEGPPQVIAREEIDPAIRIEDSRDVRFYRARYDACVRELDDTLGSFFAALRRTGRWDRTAVVVTSDHGEEFYEHGHLGHNTSVFDAQVRIPLLMKVPGVRPARLRLVAQLMDLYPTLIRIGTGRSAPPNHGNDLSTLLLSGRDTWRYAVTELPGRTWAVRSLDWKLISSAGGGGRLYHLTVDPGETRNVALDEREAADQLQRVMSAAISAEERDGRKVAGRETPIDSRVLDQLRALGYVARQ
jgi:arylsulfatase A-like enzyme